MDATLIVPTRTKRRLCRHLRWARTPRAKTFVVCADCGERFPCKATCEHADCIEARAAGAIENWPTWVREGT